MSSLARPAEDLFQTSLNHLIDKIQRLGLAPLITSLLDSGGAFTAVAAQGIYIAAPLMESLMPAGKITQLAQLMEDPEQVARLSKALKGKA